MLNTHSALLPKFGGQGTYGLAVHRAVLAAGEVRAGASVHMVDRDYDTGAVLAQCEVAVEAGDTPKSRATRVRTSAPALLVRVLGGIVAGRIRL